jgi:type VI protein secretion system component Hcp
MREPVPQIDVTLTRAGGTLQYRFTNAFLTTFGIQASAQGVRETVGWAFTTVRYTVPPVPTPGGGTAGGSSTSWDLAAGSGS